MFADVFHGLIVLLLGLYGMRLPRIDQPIGILEELKSYIQQGGPILAWCGVSSIFFGFIFGSFFGIPAYSHVLPEWVLNLNVLRWFWAFVWHGILQLQPIVGNGGHTIYITSGWFSPEADPVGSAGVMGILGGTAVLGYSGPMALLELAILVGSLQLSFGLFLYIAQLWRHHERKEAILFPAMFLVFYVCLIGLVFSLGPDPMAWISTSIQEITDLGIVIQQLLGIWQGSLIVPFVQPAFFDFRAIPVLSFFHFPVHGSILLTLLIICLLVVSIYLLMHGIEGFAELIDFALTLISNTVSYLRLFAVNTAHAVLSFLFIFLLTSEAVLGPIVMLPMVGPVGLVLGILVGTSLVSSLELLVSFLQSLRLHWVEWFSKMGYKGEGTRFSPFKAQRRITVSVDQVPPAAAV
jgi:vacuolar-type H+-ATPase subunit I/STV1